MKLHPLYHRDIWQVIEKLPAGPYRIRNIKTNEIIETGPELLKRAHLHYEIEYQMNDELQQKEIITEEDVNDEIDNQDEVYWEIEKIVDDRIKNGQLQYKVKYRNYPNKYNEWKVIDELNTNKLIEEYNNRLMKQIEQKEKSELIQILSCGTVICDM